MKIFLSYRRSDSDTWTQSLYAVLCRHLGMGSVFLDKPSIEPGEDWRRYLTEALAGCDVMLVIIGPGWINAADAQGQRRLDQDLDVVRLEIEEALHRNIRIIPILINGASMPTASQLPEGLEGLVFSQAITLTSEDRFEPEVARLVQAITRPTLHPFQEGSPELPRSVPWWSFVTDPFQPDPPERKLIRDYLDWFAGRMAEQNGMPRYDPGHPEHHYVPLQGETLNRLPDSQVGYLAPPDRQQVLAQIRREIRQIAGYCQGGDGATAQLAGRNGTARIVKDVSRLLIREHQPLILLGDPGSGKSMTLREAGRQLALRGLRERRPPVVVYVRLGEYRAARNRRPGSIWTLIKQSIPERFPELRNMLPYLVEQRRLIVLFDGMDEMERGLYTPRVEYLSAFAREYAGRVRTLFACRTNDFSPSFTHRQLVLLDFDRPQVVEFLSHNLHGWPLRVGDQLFQPETLADRMLDSSTWSESARNPLTLFLLCDYLHRHRNWPRNRGELFESYLRCLLNAPTENKYTEADWPRLRSGWARLAFRMTSNHGGTSFSCKNLGEDPAGYCIREGIRCGLLLPAESDENAVRFIHHRIQEYLTAWHLAHQAEAEHAPDWGTLIDSPRWQETLIHLVSIERTQCPALGVVWDSLREVRHSTAENRSSEDERRLADRVVLASRVVRELGEDPESLTQPFVELLNQSVEALAQTGKPTSQVKMLWAWNNAGVCPLSAIAVPLQSEVGWVREQAVKVASEQPIERQGDRLDLRRLMAQDVAAGRIQARIPAYQKAIRASGDASLGRTLTWAVWTRRLYEGSMLVLLGVALWLVFLHRPGLASCLGPLEPLAPHWHALVVLAALTLLAFVLRQTRLMDTEIRPGFWSWLAVFGAVALGVMFFAGGQFATPPQGVQFWEILSILLGWLAITQVLYWATLGMFLLAIAGSHRVLADAVVWDLAWRNSGVKPAALMGGFVGIIVMVLYGIALSATHLDVPEGTRELPLYLFGGLVLLLSVFGIVAGAREGKFWIGVGTVLGFWLLLVVGVVVLVSCATLLTHALSPTTEARVTLFYVLGWNFILALVCVAGIEMLLWSYRQLRGGYYYARLHRMSLAEWRIEIRLAVPEDQEALLHVNPRQFGLNTAEFLELLEELESYITRDPAASYYWQLRHRLEETLRQERLAVIAGIDDPTTGPSRTVIMPLPETPAAPLRWLGPWIRRVVLLLVIGCLGVVGWSFAIGNQHPLYIVNGLLEPLEIQLDDGEPLVLNHEQVMHLRIKEGPHTVRYQRRDGTRKQIDFTIESGFFARLSTRKVWVVNPEGAALLWSARSFTREKDDATDKATWKPVEGGFYIGREVLVHPLYDRMFRPLPTNPGEQEKLYEDHLGIAPELPGWLLEELPDTFTPAMSLDLAERYLRMNPYSTGLVASYRKIATKHGLSPRALDFITREMERLKLPTKIDHFRSKGWHQTWALLVANVQGQQELLTILDAKLKADPNNPFWLYFRAREEPSIEAALSYLDRAMKVEPSDNWIWDEKCRLQFARGDYAAARETARQGSEKFSWDNDFLYYLLKLGVAEGHLDDAEKRLEEIREKNKARETDRTWAVALAGLQNQPDRARQRVAEYHVYCDEELKKWPLQTAYWHRNKAYTRLELHHALKEFSACKPVVESLPESDRRWWGVMVALLLNEPVPVHSPEPTLAALLAAIQAARKQPHSPAEWKRTLEPLRRHYPAIVAVLESETAPESDAIRDLNLDPWEKAAVFLALAQRHKDQRKDWLDQAARFAHTPFAPGHYLRQVIAEEKDRVRD